MNTLRIASAAPVMAVAAGCLLAVAFVPVSAQTGRETVACGEEREIQQGLMSEATYNRMNEAFEKIGEERYDEALGDLEKLRKSRLSDFEQANIEQALGFIYAQREQYRRAIEHFSKAIELNKMPNQTHFEMILQVAQLYNAIEEYDKALEQLDFWFCISTEDAKKQADVWVLKASLHIQKNEFTEALEAIDMALELREDPPESWYRLKLGMLLELERHRPAVDVLKTLIGMSSDRKEYWIQLSGIYMELGEDANAMAAMRLAYRKGLLDKGTEYTQLAGLLQEMESPRQAAEVMQEGLKKGIIESTARNWEMVAGAWYQAREMDEALAAYERAGELSDEGKLDFQRASILVGEERWEEALAAAERALSKGGLTRSQEGNSHLLIGMAHFNLGNLNSAEQAFNRVSKYGKLRSAAREWLNHIEQTRQRLASR